MNQNVFLPINAEDARARGWERVDFVLVSGDAYVDHPSFGAALLGRMLEAQGYRVGLLPQPDFSSPEAFKEYGRPRLAFLVSGGVVDSMVAHYTAAGRLRSQDEYSPGGEAGKRPDRAVEAYSRLARAAWPDVPIVIGGVEASLRRFAHYDYWEDAVRPSILLSSGADMISYGMGEHSLAEIARRLAQRARGGAASRGDVPRLFGIPGTAHLCGALGLPKGYVECAGYAKVREDKTAYAKACALQMDQQDPLTAKPLAQRHGELYLVQSPPAAPLATEEMDALYALPFTRRWHPAYDAAGGVPGLEEVEFSLTHNRGCFGGCNFCAITLHQGRRVQTRSHQSVLAEAEALTKMPGFKGYIHDVGGPTANFRAPSCAKQAGQGLCGGGKKCLAPGPCPSLRVDHSDYLALLRRLRALPGVKKVFIRSGIRYDYLVYDKDESFFKELVEHHVSGQLKVAPEHCAPAVLKAMGKPSIGTYERFAKQFFELTRAAGKEQYLVPYLISGHPGSTLKDAVALAEWLHKNRLRPEQVQDFYPTPGTVSTCMYHTGLDPFTLKPVYVPRDAEEKAMQRALLQYTQPRKRELVLKALRKVRREDLIPVLLGGPARAGGGKLRAKAAGKPAAEPAGKPTAKPAAKPAGKPVPGPKPKWKEKH